MAGDAWTAELFRDSRGRHPVLDFLEKVSPKDREATLNRIRFVLELAKHQPVYTLGRPQIDTLEGPIKELRATDPDPNPLLMGDGNHDHAPPGSGFEEER